MEAAHHGFVPVDVRVDSKPRFLPAELVDKLALHGFDHNGRSETEVLASLQKAVVAVVFFVQGD